MLPKWHILIGFVFSYLLAHFFNISLLSALLIFSSSVLIDVDHYIHYIYKKRDISLINAYFWHKGLPKHHKKILHIFHTLEFHILVFLISFFWRPLIFIFLGLLLHSVSDLIDLFLGKMKFFREGREFFLIKYLLTRDKSEYF